MCTDFDWTGTVNEADTGCDSSACHTASVRTTTAELLQDKQTLDCLKGATAVGHEPRQSGILTNFTVVFPFVSSSRKISLSLMPRSHY